MTQMLCKRHNKFHAGVCFDCRNNKPSAEDLIKDDIALALKNEALKNYPTVSFHSSTFEQAFEKGYRAALKSKADDQGK